MTADRPATDPRHDHDLPGHKAHECRICGNWTEGAAPRAEGLESAIRAEVGPWFDEGHEAGRIDPQVLADRILARLSRPSVTEPDLRAALYRIHDLYMEWSAGNVDDPWETIRGMDQAASEALAASPSVPPSEPPDTDAALRTADVLWSALSDRLEPEERIGYGRLYEQMYSWMLDRAEAAQAAAPRAEGQRVGINGRHIHAAGITDLERCEECRRAASPSVPPGEREGLDPRGDLAIEAVDRIQRAVLMKGRVASDGTLVTTEVIESEARAAIRDFHDRSARLSGERGE